MKPDGTRTYFLSASGICSQWQQPLEILGERSLRLRRTDRRRVRGGPGRRLYGFNLVRRRRRRERNNRISHVFDPESYAGARV